MDKVQLPHEKYYRKKPVRKFDLNQTLYNTIFEQNKENMNTEAIGFLGTNITYFTLKQNVDKLADAYVRNGIKEGSTVGICTINMPLVQENLLALSKIGATSLWIDLRMKGKDLIKKINEKGCKTLVIFDGITSTIEEIINETDVSLVLVASPKDYLNPFIRILSDIKDKKEDKVITLPKDKRFGKYSNFLKSGNLQSEVKAVSFEKERPSIIVQSSGSTGVAKSIVHTEYNFNSLMQKEAYTDLPFCVGKTMYASIPPFIIYGLCGSLYVALAFGLKAEMTPYVSETTLFDDLGKYDFAAAAPIHYRYLYNKIIELQNKIMELEEKIKQIENESSHISRKQIADSMKELLSYTKKYSIIKEKLSRAKCFVSGGDKITVEELLAMQQLFEVPIINGYGNNELTGGAIIMPVYASKPASVGIPMKGISVAAFNPNTLEKLNNGEEGEICINSDSVFVEYLNNEIETKKIKQIHSDNLEWIHTGDLGYVDQDGYVYITGRVKRLIKREAFKIAPDTIENLIMKVEGVKDCVVVGVPDIEHEESSVPMAYVELQTEFIDSFEKIRAKIEQKCMEELPDYEKPEYIVNIEKIPYHNTKHAFKELEKMGKEYVEKIILDNKKYVKRNK